MASVLGNARESSSATIEVLNSNKTTVVVVQGTIGKDDDDDFREKTRRLSSAFVVFASDGGNLIAGISIGEEIRRKKFSTVVLNGNNCASACALAWRGGSRRFMEQNSKIGFHAAYHSETRAETGLGNALVGAYLAKLGLPYRAVYYITKAEPNSMTWLSLEDANTYGIEVNFIETQTRTADERTPGSSSLSARPGFDCARPSTNPIRQILCIDTGTARAYWDLTSAYWARRFSMREEEREIFDKNEESWRKLLLEFCDLFPNQGQFTVRHRECVLTAYHKRAEQYRSRLSGDELAEAMLTPEEHAEIQSALIELGLLNDVADGEFGPLTRSAIKLFRLRNNFQPSEVLTAPQRAILFAQARNSSLAQSSGSGSPTCTITSSDANLNVRNAPRGQILANLPSGTRINVVEMQNDDSGNPWVRISTPISGWVFAKFVFCSTGSSSLINR